MSAADVETPVFEVPVADESKSPETEKSTKDDNLKTQRRRSFRPRKIPRQIIMPNGHHHKGKDLMSSPQKPRNGGGRGRRSRSRTSSEVSIVSTISESGERLKKLRDQVVEKHEKKGLHLLNSYIKNRMELAKFVNATDFLQRCDALWMVPKEYVLENQRVKNTSSVLRILDSFSLKLVRKELQHNRTRCPQIQKLLAEKTASMKELFDEELLKEAISVADEAFERRNTRIKEQHTRAFDALVKAYGLTEDELKAGEERLKVNLERQKEREERRAAEREQRRRERQEKREAAAAAKVEGADKDGDAQGGDAAKDANDEQ